MSPRRSRRPGLPLAAALTALTCLAGPLAAAPPKKPAAKPKSWTDQPLNDQLVTEAIGRGVEFLWSRQDPKEFHWEKLKNAEFAKFWKDKDKTIANWMRQTYVHDQADHSGLTALVLLSLYKAGADRNDPRFRGGLAWLAEAPGFSSYAHSLKGILWGTLGPTVNRRAMDEQKAYLLDAIYADGGTGYHPPANDAKRMKPPGNITDLSNTQYAVLAAWALDDAGAEFPARYWQLIQNYFLTSQNKDGGWAYRPPGNATFGGSYANMTLAALASEFIVWDKLYTTAGCDQRPDPRLVKSIEAGLDWLAANFTLNRSRMNPRDASFPLYMCYGVERVAVAGGIKYFGQLNWWDQAARYVLHGQSDRTGGWAASSMTPAEANTAYAVLFLSYGRAPVVFNKLAYGSPAQWNSRPRDLARLTAWMDNTYEQLFNWQIMPIDRPVAELLDAPILLLSGKAAISLTAAEKAKLRDYVLGGGLLLGEAAGNSAAFAASFRALCRELFPELELTPLAPDHPLYTIQFPLGGPGEPGMMALPKLEGLSNGVRTMVLLSPADLGCQWQRYNITRARSHFQLGGNLMQYVSDRGTGLIGRGSSYLVPDKGNKPAASITVGRLAWGGKFQSDPEPWAWRNLDVRLRNAEVMSVATTACDLSAAVDPKAVPVLHVTGAGPIRLTEPQRANLKRYVADGGLLLADAAGGSREFVESFEKLAADLFGRLTPAIVPFAEAGTDGGKVTMRHEGRLPRSVRPLELLGWRNAAGQWGVLFVPCDVTAALVGYPNAEPVGLTTESADRLLAALLQWRLKSLAAPAAP